MKKYPHRESQGGSWGIGDVHESAWDPKVRLDLMDEFGIASESGRGTTVTMIKWRDEP